jgi:hypothetical protein
MVPPPPPFHRCEVFSPPSPPECLVHQNPSTYNQKECEEYLQSLAEMINNCPEDDYMRLILAGDYDWYNELYVKYKQLAQRQSGKRW